MPLVTPQLFEQLVRTDEIVEALKALALLVDLLIRRIPLEQLILHFFKNTFLVATVHLVCLALFIIQVILIRVFQLEQLVQQIRQCLLIIFTIRLLSLAYEAIKAEHYGVSNSFENIQFVQDKAFPWLTLLELHIRHVFLNSIAVITLLNAGLNCNEAPSNVVSKRFREDTFSGVCSKSLLYTLQYLRDYAASFEEAHYHKLQRFFNKCHEVFEQFMVLFPLGRFVLLIHPELERIVCL